ncbi:hypothetical protein N752_26410 [Desulforamulus aquiferis]|nr:hypothetical protein N752_26410 [Desulforamulus aquiferis]
MPGIYNLSIDTLLEEASKVAEAGIPGILVFGIPEEKDEVGSGAYAGWYRPAGSQGIKTKISRAISNYGCMSMRIYQPWSLWSDSW